MPLIYFAVTTDLSYDQRMIRICTSLANAGYKVKLIGRKTQSSIPLSTQPYRQKRIDCFFEKGKMFYAEYNLRLFFYLLLKKMDCICAIDLDTIIPCYLVSKINRVKRVYDAHELFCEMKEIVERPQIYKIWKWIEKNTVPHFTKGYTVNKLISDEFKNMYRVQYKVIRSIARYEPIIEVQKKEKYILYQGAVNEGRSFETLIPAMKWVNATLVICGDGNFMEQAKKLAADYHLSEKIIFKGILLPSVLKNYTLHAYIGITLFENKSLSNYYSLANRFFDYIHAGLPQLCVNYPAYHEINNKYNVAVLVNDLSPGNLAKELNKLLNNDDQWQQLHQNCKEAANDLNWQNEEIKLLEFYTNIFE